MESLIGNLTNLSKETHMTWRLVHDPTVETQSAPSWRQHVQTLWSFLGSDYRVSADTTCSTHVHVSKAEGYTAQQMKRLAQAFIHFEPAFEALVPSERRRNEYMYARSHWIDNKNFGYQRLSRQESITVLEKCITVREIVDFMNPDGSKYYGWNFQAIQKGLDKSPDARLDPVPVGELTPDKLKKLKEKIRLDQQMNP
ncbi:hypothetical protein diail_1762, partial [Diaporthe ilicicola]